MYICTFAAPSFYSAVVQCSFFDASSSSVLIYTPPTSAALDRRRRRFFSTACALPRFEGSPSLALSLFLCSGARAFMISSSSYDRCRAHNVICRMMEERLSFSLMFSYFLFNFFFMPRTCLQFLYLYLYE